MRFLPLFLLLLAAVPAVGADATITVNVAQPGASVSPQLYGIFLEEINHAADGGIYAELVRNRAFNENGAQLTYWSALGGAALSSDASEHYGSLTRSLKMQLPGSGRAGVSNGGFWGIRLNDGVTYTATVWAKAAAGFSGPLRLTLESSSGAVLAQTSIDTLSTDWRKYVRLLTVQNPAGDTSDNSLVIASTAQGAVWLQLVSLFPPTWNSSRNGLRTDLAQVLAALQPKTMRFPGGAFVQGFNLTSSPWHWKNTLGDLTDRPGHPGLWGYYSSDGMGFYEYLQMTEDLGAEPILCVFSGKDTGTDVVAQINFDAVVQDALDAIEYANGDPETTTWGAVRAANGHYPPFHLKYIEFGNEDNLSDPQKTYTAYRLPMFLAAIRARYPDIEAISTVGNLPAGIVPDLVDDHLYASTSSLLQASRNYDSRSRVGPHVLVGEYAANDLANVAEPQRQNTLGGAIGEAGFMTGLERNSDLVWSALYAPLFVNDANHTWNPDLIWFNADQVLLTPNYWVQKMFGTHVGDAVLPVSIAGSGGLYGSATLASADQTVYLKIVNNNTAPQNIAVVLSGAADVSAVSAQTTLTSGSRADQNTFAAPSTVAPATTVLSGVSPNFSAAIAANSVTVLTFTRVLPAAGPRSAFGKIEAESFDSAPSVTVEAAADTGLDIVSPATGSIATYQAIDFGSGAIAMEARGMSDAGGTIEIRLDSADAGPAGTCTIPSAATWTTTSCALSGVSRVHDLYLVMSGSLRLDWVRFLSAPKFTAASVTNGASFRRGLVPGSIATIFGTGLSSATGVVKGGLPLPSRLAGASVTVNGIPAPLLSVANVNGAEQINLQVPFEIAGQTTAQIVITNNGMAGDPVTVDVWPAQPGIFTFDGFTGAILHGATYAPVTSTNPAAKGEIVLIFATGLGDVSNPPATGAAAGASPNTVPAAVEIGGSPAQVSYSGLAPGFAGLYQINVTVPADAPSGVAPVTVTAHGAVSQQAGIAVQ